MMAARRGERSGASACKEGAQGDISCRCVEDSERLSLRMEDGDGLTSVLCAARAQPERQEALQNLRGRNEREQEQHVGGVVWIQGIGYGIAKGCETECDTAGPDDHRSRNTLNAHAMESSSHAPGRSGLGGCEGGRVAGADLRGVLQDEHDVVLVLKGSVLHAHWPLQEAAESIHCSCDFTHRPHLLQAHVCHRGQSGAAGSAAACMPAGYPADPSRATQGQADQGGCHQHDHNEMTRTLLMLAECPGVSARGLGSKCWTGWQSVGV